MVKLIPDNSIVTLQSGALMVTTKSVLLDDELCFAVVPGSEIVAVVEESKFTAVMCIRNKYYEDRCIITVAFTDWSEFLKIVGDMDAEALKEIYA